ncbi:MAG: hypothetical protein OEV42_03055 [Deltaproteobacteria bacterium]|nr:hypothetical protein [Deltaproteobacteria bacterium]
MIFLHDRLASFLIEDDANLNDHVIASIRRLNRSLPGKLFKYSAQFIRAIEREVKKSVSGIP